MRTLLVLAESLWSPGNIAGAIGALAIGGGLLTVVTVTLVYGFWARSVAPMIAREIKTYLASSDGRAELQREVKTYLVMPEGSSWLREAVDDWHEREDGIDRVGELAKTALERQTHNAEAVERRHKEIRSVIENEIKREDGLIALKTDETETRLTRRFDIFEERFAKYLDADREFKAQLKEAVAKLSGQVGAMLGPRRPDSVTMPATKPASDR